MLADVEDAIIARCQQVVGQSVRTVEDLPGRWDEQTLRSAMRQAPGVYVSWSGGRGEGNASQPRAALRYAIYFVTSHASGERARRRGDSREVGAYELIERVVPAVHGLTVDGVGTLALESVDNLYSSRLEQQGVMVYGASYRLAATFPAPLDVNTLDAFTTYHATHQVGGADDPDAVDQVDLPQ